MDRFERWLKEEKTLGLGVSGVEVVERPDSHFVVFRFFFEALTNGKREVLLDEQLINIVGVSLVEQSLLLKWRIEAQELVGLRVQDLLRELGVLVEVDLATREVRVPAHDSVQSHHGIWFQNELVLLLVYVSRVRIRIVQALVLIQSDFRRLFQTLGLQIVIVFLLQLLNFFHSLLFLTVQHLHFLLILLLSTMLYFCRCLGCVGAKNMLLGCATILFLASLLFFCEYRRTIGQPFSGLFLEPRLLFSGSSRSPFDDLRGLLQF